MIYILTSSGNTLEVDVRLQEVRKGDAAVTATLALALKPALSKEVFSEQQEYLITSSKAAYVALNNIDQRNRFKASVNIHSASSNAINLIAGSSSACLGFTLALFNAFWTKQLCKGKGLTTAIFATGEVQSNGDIKAISYLQEKLQSTIAFAQEHQLSQFIICIPQSNASHIPDALQKQIEQSGGQIVSARRVPDLLELLLGSEYDGETLGRWAPFKGLKSFEYEDSIRFFGRDREIERLYDDLEHNRGILIVSGPSGSGKSSLVKAGLIPKLASQKSNFRWTSITPTILSQPLVTFLLSESLHIGEPGGMGEKLNTNISSLISHPDASFNELVKEINKHDRLFLLHIDQFEDFFTQDVNHKNLEDLQLIHKLTKATDNVKVVLSIRNEYLSILLESGFIASPVISNVSENLSVEAWRDIVIQQAAFSGVNYENTPENLAQRIINEAVKTSNALPMVEFVLEQLYEQAKQEDIDANYLRNQDYDALGGIKGAIAQRAENAVKLSGADGKITHHFFSIFVGVTSDGIPYAKQVVINEPVTNANTELTTLIQALLDSNIVIKVGSSKLIVMKLSHDSLFQHWERLKDWLIDKASFLDWKNTIELNYQRWLKNGLNKKHLINDNSLLDEGVAFVEEHTLVDRDLSQYVNDSKGYKRKKIITNFGLFLVLPLLLILIFWWDKNISRSEYYAAVGHRWEVPFGVGELNTEQLNKKQFRYRFVYQGGLIAKHLGYGNKLLELRHENSLGNLMRFNLLHETDVAKSIFTYKQNGYLDTVTNYDSSKKIIEKRSYQFTENKVTVSFLNENNYSKKYKGLSTNKVTDSLKFSNIVRVEKHLNVDGLVKKEIYQKDGFGNITNDVYGVSGLHYTFNGLGLIESKTEISLNNTGLVTNYSYNLLGLVVAKEFIGRKNVDILESKFSKIKYTYDGYGNYLRRELFDSYGKPALTKNTSRTFYHGNYLQRDFFDSTEQSTANKYGLAITRDYRGWAIEFRFINIENIPLPGGDIEGGIKITYTTKGYITKQTLISRKSEPMMSYEGFSTIQYFYDNDGSKIKTLNVDEANSPVKPIDKHYAGYKIYYDERGNDVEYIFLGNDGLPLKTTSQMVRVLRSYNNRGNLFKIESYAANNRRILNPISNSGCAIRKLEYNNKQNVISDRCFDEQELPGTFNNWNVSIIKAEDDENGNIVKLQTFNESGSLAISPMFGFAQILRSFDDKGNTNGEIYLGIDGEPMLHLSHGVAGFKAEYDDMGNQLKFVTLGTNLKPMIEPEIGAAGFEAIYDEEGNTIRFINLGLDENPMLDKTGMAGAENEYDENRNQIKFIALGTDLKPINIPPENFYAGWSKEFDKYGNEVRNITLGPDRNPIAEPESGWAGSKQRFDDKGNMIAVIYLGVDELPLLFDGGAGFSYEYDLRGNITKQMNLGPDEQPMISPNNGIAGFRQVFDERDNITKIIYLGIDEQPMMHPVKGRAGWEKTYDLNGNVINEIDLDIDGNPITIQ